MFPGAYALLLLIPAMPPQRILAAGVLLILCGATVYSLLSVAAALRYLQVRPAALTKITPISILKPLAGAEEGLEENLRSFFEQRYGEGRAFLRSGAGAHFVDEHQGLRGGGLEHRFQIQHVG